MAKKAKKRPPRKPVRRRSSRVEQQRRFRKIIIGSAIGVAILIVGLLGYGLFFGDFVKLRQPVAIVNGVTITGADLRARVDLLQRYYMMSLPAEQVDFVLDMLIQEELLRQELVRRGLAVTDEDVQRRIEEDYGYYRVRPTPTPEPTATATLTATEVATATPSTAATVTSTEVLTPTPTLVPTPTPMTEEAFQQQYAETLALRGLSDEEYRAFTRSQLLYEVLLEDSQREVPVTADQVQVRYLQVDSQEKADELVERLEEGTSFEALKEEVEADAEAPGYGSELQWYTKDTLEQALGADIAAQAFSMKSGVFSAQGAMGTVYYTVEVVDHQESREVDDELSRQLAAVELQEWLDTQMNSVVERLEYDPALMEVEMES
jgi:parvulin-like peptidyl-prolyl isomerase